ncbi:MAG: hypothetical protein E7369_01970 [Clostridiales bacterium]|nr:hypothetical protein [Clostridiales bacterium]
METLYNFFKVYGLSAIAIALITAVTKILLDKFLPKKYSQSLKSVLPFGVSTILSFLYNLIFYGFNQSTFEGSISTGLLSGTIALTITTIVYKVKAGKPIDPFNGVRLVIESILADYIDDALLGVAVVAVESIIDNLGEINDEEVVNEVAKTVKEYRKAGVTDLDGQTAAVLTVNAVKSLKT